MTPEEVKQFKDKASKLQNLETTRELLLQNQIHLNLAGEGEKTYVKVEVNVRGTNTTLWLSDEMMKAVHLALSLMTENELRRVKQDIEGL